MSYINTNINSIVAQQNLDKARSSEQTALTRLSTGLRINSGADDPSGLIAANALGSDITGVQTAISNSQQANEVVATASGALTQISSLLNTIRGLVTQAANSGALSSSQIAANQQQVDASLQAINQISSTTQFQGKNLLDGSLGFTTQSVSSANIATLNIQQATIGHAPTTLTTTPASAASLTFSANTNSDTGISFTLTGSLGSATISNTGVTSASTLTGLINAQKSATGVSADSSSGSIVLSSTGTGSSALIQVTGLTEGTAAGHTGFNLANANPASAATYTLGSATGSDAGFSFQLTGSLGSATISSSATTSASTLQTLINAQSATTGVSADTSSGSIVLTSAGTGSSADISVTNLGESTSTGHTGFGFVTSTNPSAAQVTLVAPGGQSDSSVSFVLQGSLGSALISSDTSALSTVSSLTTLINAATAQTGVTADSSGGGIVLNSTGTGSGASISFTLASETTVAGHTGYGFTSGSATGTSGSITTATGTDAAAVTANGTDAVTQSLTGVAVNINVSTAASLASITGQSTSAALASQQVIEVAGALGSQVYTFGTGTTTAQIANAINLDSSTTGVTADSTGSTLNFNSQDYGSAQTVSIQQISGAGFSGAGTIASGTDVAGNINGSAFTGAGLNISLNTSALSLTTGLTASFGTATGTTSFNITGGGATFQIGSDVLTNQQVRIGINSVNSANLGGVVDGARHNLFEIGSGQAANLAGDPSTAYQIVNAAITQVSTLQGTLGAIQATTLNSNEASLNDRLTNLTQAQSQIQDANFASETANLTRAQILVQSTTSVLQIANSAPQQILALLPHG